MTPPGAERPGVSTTRPGRAPRWLNPRVIAFLVVLGLAIAFIVENQHEVRTHFVFFTVTAKTWVGFLVCLVMGAILGRVATVWWRRRG